MQASWATYQLRGIWRSEDNVLQLLCMPDIRIAEDKRAAMVEVLALINEQLWLGHFDIWSNGAVLLYRHGLMLGDDGLLSLAPGANAGRSWRWRNATAFIPRSSSSCGATRRPAEALASALVDAAGEA